MTRRHHASGRQVEGGADAAPVTAESAEPAAPVLPPHFDEQMLGATLEVLARELFSARASASVRQIAHEALLVSFCLPGVSAGAQGSRIVV